MTLTVIRGGRQGFQRKRPCEELFLFGIHIEQYRHATRDPTAYYLEGLRRDPTDARLNHAYGKLLLNCGLIAASIPFFEAAVEKLTVKNPNPYGGEPLSNLESAYDYLDQHDLAYDSYFKAAWTAAWQDAAFYLIGAIDMMRGDAELAVEHLTLALERNARNLKARGAIVLLLREAGRTSDAVAAAREILHRDPHDVIALRELAILEGRPVDWTALPGINANSAIEYALCYAEWGRHGEAVALLREYIASCPYAGKAYPLVYCHLYAVTGDEAVLELAEAAAPDYCFPRRLEDMLALEKVIRSAKPCARALYYLGNLWYDRREAQRAIECWEKAFAQRDDLATPHRNLALGYYNKCDRPQDALRELERAFELNPADSRVFFELDLMRKKLGVGAQERLDAMETRMDLVLRRNDFYLEYVACLNELGRYSEALEKMAARRFHPWEGGEGKIPTQWRIARVQLAKRRLAKGDPSGALEHLTIAAGLSKPTGMLYYNDQPPEMIYYQVLPCAALGDRDGAAARFRKPVSYGDAHLNDSIVMDYFAVSLLELQIFDEDLNRRNRIHCLFMKALGRAGLGQTDAAGETLGQLEAIDPNHPDRRYHIQ